MPEAGRKATGTKIGTALVGQQTGRAETILRVSAEGDWLSAAAAPEAITLRQRGSIFGVQGAGQLYFAQ